jgi:hypothetical protein
MCGLRSAAQQNPDDAAATKENPKIPGSRSFVTNDGADGTHNDETNAPEIRGQFEKDKDKLPADFQARKTKVMQGRAIPGFNPARKPQSN